MAETANWRRVLHAAVAAAAGALPLAAYYLIVAPENVFHQPASATGLLLGALALVVPILLESRAWRRTGPAMVGAALIVTTAFVFTRGPGNLWPIAIVLGTGAAAVPIVAGTLAAAVVTERLRARARSGPSA